MFEVSVSPLLSWSRGIWVVNKCGENLIRLIVFSFFIAELGLCEL